MVKWRLDRADDKGDIIEQIEYQIKNNATYNQTYQLQLDAYYSMDKVLIELLAGHSAVFMLWLLPIITCCCGAHNSRIFKRVCEAIAVLAYLRTIFVACAKYPGNNVIIRSSTLQNIPSFMNATEWIRLEIRVFFALIIFGILFIFISFLKKPFNLLKSLDEEGEQAPA